jgi:hypothetical protein
MHVCPGASVVVVAQLLDEVEVELEIVAEVELEIVVEVELVIVVEVVDAALKFVVEVKEGNVLVVVVVVLLEFVVEVRGNAEDDPELGGGAVLEVFAPLAVEERGASRAGVKIGEVDDDKEVIEDVFEVGIANMAWSEFDLLEVELDEDVVLVEG